MAKNTEELRKLAADAHLLVKQKEKECALQFAQSISTVAVDEMVSSARAGEQDMTLVVRDKTCTFSSPDTRYAAANYLSEFLEKQGFKGVQVSAWCEQTAGGDPFWSYPGPNKCKASFDWKEHKHKSLW